MMAKPRRKGASKQMLILLVGGFCMGVAGIAFYFVYQASLDVKGRQAHVEESTGKADDGEMDAATREKVAAATVAIRVKYGKQVTLGTGFFCDRNSIVTDVDVLGEFPDVGSFNGTLEVVLNSGIAGKEAVYPAKLTVLDPYSRLAFLTPTGVKSPPEPLDLGSTQFINTSTPVFVAQCRPSQANPGESEAIEIAPCTVDRTELRKSGTPVLIVNGTFGLACGGAPLVSNHGQLLALTPHHKKVVNSTSTVPLEDVKFSLSGYVCDLNVKTTTKNGDRYTFDITATCIDPLERSRTINFYYWTAGENNSNPTGKSLVELKRVGNTATWKGSVSDLVLPRKTEFWSQTGFKATDGESCDVAYNRAAELGVPGAEVVVVEAPRSKAPRYTPPPTRVVVQPVVAQPPPPPDSPGWNLGYTSDNTSGQKSGDYETKGNSWDSQNKSVRPTVTSRR